MPDLDPLATPSRIAFAGDWHGNAEYAYHVMEYVADEGAQVVVHVGDYGFKFRPQFVKDMEWILRQFGIPILFVDGNHDHHAAINRRALRPNGLRRISDHVWYLPRGFRWTWDGVRFLACGGAYSVDRTIRDEQKPPWEWWPTETITDEDATKCVSGGPTDVLVSHDAPAGITALDTWLIRKGPSFYSPVDLDGADKHRQRLREIVERVTPRFVVHGHYHYPYRASAFFDYGPASIVGLGPDGVDFPDNTFAVDLKEFAP